MTFARKIFIAVFLSTLIVGSLLIWGAHRYVETRAESDFVARYTVFAKILADTLTRLDTNTEALMMNAAQVIAEKDKAKGLLSTEELRQLQSKLGITHLFIIDRTGRFVRSTNDDPAGIPNLFSFSPNYRKLLTGELAVEATPVIKPNPEPKPFKFLSIPNFNRTRIIEVGVRVDFIANTLAQAIGSDKNVLSMSLYGPDGTPFGTFSENNVIFESQKAELPKSFQAPIETSDSIKFFSKVTSSHSQCGQCDVSGTSVGGEYYYVLESTVSKAELRAIQAKASYIFLLVGFGNALLAWALARWLSSRLVRNIELAVKRVRDLKDRGTFDGRVGFDADDEVAFLTQEFDRLLDSLQQSQRQLIEAEKVQSKVELARVVAHNIKSPILAIEMMLPGLVGVPERMKRVLRAAVSEIKLLSDKLKTQADGMVVERHADMETDFIFVPIFLDDLVTQKKLEFSSQSRSNVVLVSSGVTDGMFVKVSSVELKAIISNLINNASEAYGPTGGMIKVSAEQRGNKCLIKVSDSGVGIPNEYLAKLGRENISFKGNCTRGIGLVHAFKTAEAWGGSISIESSIGSGTSVTIELPRYIGEPNVVSYQRSATQ